MKIETQSDNTRPRFLGLALSGGGSRAIAFHRGTVQALLDLGLVDAIDVVSTVSGGSVFGAGWMCALAKGDSTEAFLDALPAILQQGFVRPALLSFRALKVLLPCWTRTNRLAETFDELLTFRRKLHELPQHPALCMHATVLNHAAAGRFSSGGFSCRSVGTPDEHRSYPDNPVPVTVGFAAAASAAFPFGLPPLRLSTRALLPLQDPIRGHQELILTDGGVNENLGVQLLLRSHRFGTRSIVVSDAGTAQRAWKPTLLGRLESFAAFALTRDTLSQLLCVMNDKQNKSMREIVMHECGSLDPPNPGRKLWLVRIDQTWSRFLTGIPLGVRARIADGSREFPAPSAAAPEIETFLTSRGVDLSAAWQDYQRMGGDQGAARANATPTQFTGLAAERVRELALHAAWQVRACHAVYGAIAAASAAPLTSAA